jgi:hypothetical protein
MNNQNPKKKKNCEGEEERRRGQEKRGQDRICGQESTEVLAQFFYMYL